MNVLVERANSLQFPELVSSTAGVQRFDPYVSLTLDGMALQIIKRTPADKDGGKDPIWNNDITFQVVDQYQMQLQVYNQAVAGKDILLGYAEISLLPAYRNGVTEFWTALKQQRANGGIKEVGDILLKLSFVGPPNVYFPQLRDEVDKFDDTLRKAPLAGQEKKSEEEEDAAQVKPVISTIPTSEKPTDDEMAAIKQYGEKKIRNEEPPSEFTEEEIKAAFAFIDLDHNNFVGAAEIRHILVCMGELITDEEIDMMIAMVDMDGDGQVSYKEFRALVIHPNPGLVDMHKELNADKDNEIMKDKQTMAGKNPGVDLDAFQRQKELLKREQKKKIIQQFILDNEITYEYLKQSHTTFLDLPKEQRLQGKIKFPQFCMVMRIEPITEYKTLHSYYDDEENGELDLREFVLNLLNFISIEKDERIKFSFEMFDEMKTGFIAQREIEEILRGNHILSIASVKRKAETIMRQAHTNEAGAITLKEFLIVSKKFPNILFPTAGVLDNPKKVAKK